MKYINITKFVLSLALVAGLGSCAKMLDIEPQQSIDAEVALNSSEGVQSATMGLYGILGQPSLYGTNLLMLPELSGSEGYISWFGTFVGYRHVANKTMLSDNTEATRTWMNAYRAINHANNILESLSVVDEGARNRVEGEALFVRGILHFELVRLYALPYVAGQNNSQLGVPYMTQGARTVEQASVRVPRNTVEQVYAGIINDLTRAESLLPESNARRADAFTAAAFLSRVYLQQGNYEAARDAAHRVIDSRRYSLNASVLTAFRNRNTGESVFEIQQNEQNNAGRANDGMATFFASLDGIGRGDIRVNPAFINMYMNPDSTVTDNRATIVEDRSAPRGDAMFYLGRGRRPNAIYVSKWDDPAQNLPVVRLAEMHLTRAEANFRLGTEIGASPLQDINLIRTRSNAQPLAQATLQNILRERQLELAFEGHRIHDLKRTQRPTGTLAFNDPRLIFPIPQREIDANDQLVQNPGYGQ
jgi:starch-binding outer membrane protein, SusD/RagB family